MNAVEGNCKIDSPDQGASGKVIRPAEFRPDAGCPPADDTADGPPPAADTGPPDNPPPQPEWDRFMWERAFVEDDSLPPTTRTVLFVLRMHMDERGRCYPSMATIADKSNVSRRTARRHVKKAVEAGWVQRSRQNEEDRWTFQATYPEERVDQLDLPTNDPRGRTPVSGEGGGQPCPPGGRTPVSPEQINQEQTMGECEGERPREDSPLVNEQPDEPPADEPPTPDEGPPPIEEFFEVDREPLPKDERHDFMQLQQQWRRYIGKPLNVADTTKRRRARCVVAHFTEAEILNALRETRRRANNPGWGYFRSTLDGKASESFQGERNSPTGTDNENTSETGGMSRVTSDDWDDADYDDMEVLE